MPLLFSFLLALAEGKRAIKVIKLGQNPLPNEKVFQKTKYKYGIKAKIQPIVMLSFIVFIFLFSFWGAIQAHEFTQDIKACEKTLTRIL